MKKLFIALLSLAISLALLSQETPETPAKTRSLNMTAGVNFGFDSIACTLGDGLVENTLTILYATVEYNLELFDYLSVGILAGYKFSYMNDPVDFLKIPLSVTMDRETSKGKFSGLVFGGNLQSTPFSVGDFSLKLRGDFLYSPSGSKEWPITLDVVSGTLIVDESFFLITGDVLIQYEGFSGFNLFAGCRFNILSGSYLATETLEDLNGSEDLKFSQKNLLGPVAGAVFELGSNWEVTLKASLISRFSAMLAIQYIF